MYLTGRRTIKVSYSINLISYLFVFIVQIFVIYGYLAFDYFTDKQTIKKWNDLALLDGETGYIYTVKYSTTENLTKYVYNRYDVEHKKWEIVDPGFEKGIDPAVWDVKGNLIACIVETGDRENRTVTVINATTFSKIAQIDGNFRETRISPDLSKLAVLEYVRQIIAPRDDERFLCALLWLQVEHYDLKSGYYFMEGPSVLALDWMVLLG